MDAAWLQPNIGFLAAFPRRTLLSVVSQGWLPRVLPLLIHNSKRVAMELALLQAIAATRTWELTLVIPAFLHEAASATLRDARICNLTLNSLSHRDLSLLRALLSPLGELRVPIARKSVVEAALPTCYGFESAWGDVNPRASHGREDAPVDSS